MSLPDAEPRVPAPPPPVDAAPEVPAPPPSRLLRRSRRTSRLLLESALIVASVLLGFALTQWNEQRRERLIAAAALDSFRRELQANLAHLERVHAKHVLFAERLGTIRPDSVPGQTAFDVFLGVMPEGGLELLPLREAAWEAAVSTGALRLLDYETAARLSEVYLVQRLTLSSTMARMSDRFMDVPNFDPRSRDTMLGVHRMLLVELSSQETYLMEMYRGTLKQLAKKAR